MLFKINYSMVCIWLPIGDLILRHRTTYFGDILDRYCERTTIMINDQPQGSGINYNEYAWNE